MYRLVGITTVACVLSSLACNDGDRQSGKLLAGAPVEVESSSAYTPIQIAGEDMGACCRTGASRAPAMCMQTSRDNCVQSHGVFAAGQECGPDSCRSGSCCVDRICDLKSGECCDSPTGENCDLIQPFLGCARVIQLYCASIEGEFGGVGSSCSAADCDVATGACCVNDDDSPPGCVDTDALACLQMGGEYSGDDTTCVDDLCVFDEACCFPSGVCHDLKPDLCLTEGGVSEGFGSRCESSECGDLEGACCVPNVQFPSGIQCLEIGADNCSNLGGEFFGIDTSCEDINCGENPVQACCTVVGNCFDVTPEVCSREGGESAGPGTSCDSHNCDQGEGD